MTASTADSVAELDAQAAALLNDLEALNTAPVDVETLPDWLREYSRVKGRIQTLWAERLLATKRDSNDAQAQAVYKHLMGSWIPKLEAYEEPLNRAALNAGLAETQPGLARKLEAELGGQHTEELREALAQERLLSSRYSVITSNQVVELAGTSLPAHQAQDRLKSKVDAGEREAIWHAIKRSDLKVSSDLDALFADLLRARQRVAVHAGRNNYAEHVWQQANREYTIEEAVEFLDGIAEVFGPLTAQVDYDRAEKLGLGRLKPWDLTSESKPPTSTTLETDQYVDIAAQVLERLDPAFGMVVREMEAEGRIDLGPRLGKDKGNLSIHLFAYGTSEVLCSDTDGFKGLGTLLHELGHSVHSHFLSSNPDNLVWDLYGFTEIREFCAFIFTALGESRLLEHLKLSQDEQRWYRRSLAQSFLARLRDVDERLRMELWLYQQTRDITTEEIDAHYLTLYRRPAVDWAGHEDRLRKGWQNRFLFLYSFYNIEYSIATVAALLFVQAYREDPTSALGRFKQAMRAGATVGPSAIFAQAGIRFPFSREQLIIARDVLAEWLS